MHQAFGIKLLNPILIIETCETSEHKLAHISQNCAIMASMDTPGQVRVCGVDVGFALTQSIDELTAMNSLQERTRHYPSLRLDVGPPKMEQGPVHLTAIQLVPKLYLYFYIGYILVVRDVCWCVSILARIAYLDTQNSGEY